MLKNLTGFTGKKRERNVFSAIYTQKGWKKGARRRIFNAGMGNIAPSSYNLS